MQWLLLCRWACAALPNQVPRLPDLHCCSCPNCTLCNVGAAVRHEYLSASCSSAHHDVSGTQSLYHAMAHLFACHILACSLPSGPCNCRHAKRRVHHLATWPSCLCAVTAVLPRCCELRCPGSPQVQAGARYRVENLPIQFCGLGT